MCIRDSAPIAVTALRMGKHVYCQKPLTHSIFEARKLAEEAARRPELVTQMGVQTHSHASYRTAVAMVQAGVIGKVKEVHSWDIVRFHYTGAVTDPPQRRRPDRADKVPDTLNWDLWLGVAPERPYVTDLYHTRWWRRWHDFGGGAHGAHRGVDLVDPGGPRGDVPNRVPGGLRVRVGGPRGGRGHHHVLRGAGPGSRSGTASASSAGGVRAERAQRAGYPGARGEHGRVGTRVGEVVPRHRGLLRLSLIHI